MDLCDNMVEVLSSALKVGPLYVVNCSRFDGYDEHENWTAGIFTDLREAEETATQEKKDMEAVNNSYSCAKYRYRVEVVMVQEENKIPTITLR